MFVNENPLTYKTETLIATLNERLAERQREREAKAQEAAARNQKARDQIVELLDKYPSFLVWLSGSLNTQWRVGNPGTDAFATAIDSAYAAQDNVAAGRNYNPDEDLERLIRVYEKAEDKEVKITVNDDVFIYL